jgi:hypothetical protein
MLEKVIQMYLLVFIYKIKETVIVTVDSKKLVGVAPLGLKCGTHISSSA